MKHVLYIDGHESIEIYAVNPNLVLIDSQPGRVPEAVAEVAPELIPHLIKALQDVYDELKETGQ